MKCNRCQADKPSTEFYAGRKACKSCKKADSRQYYGENQEAGKEVRKAYYEANKADFIKRAKQTKQVNPERTRAYARKYQAQKVVTGYAAANCARRRSRLANQSPVLSSIERMMVDNYYSMAKELGVETGQVHEVDHIVPLKLGGLHAPWNLQVLTAEENRKKSCILNPT